MNNLVEAGSKQGGGERHYVYVVSPCKQSFDFFEIACVASRVRWKKICVSRSGEKYCQISENEVLVKDPRSTDKNLVTLSVNDVGTMYIPASWMENPGDENELPDPNILFRKLLDN